jgi:hypothetical protein
MLWPRPTGALRSDRMFFKMSPLLATLLLVGGCYRNTIETGLPAANAMPYQETAQFFLWGLVGHPP